MTRENKAFVDELLRLGAESWIALADVVEVVERDGRATPDAAVDVVRDLLVLRLAEIGELDENGFQHWDGSLDEHLERVRAATRGDASSPSGMHGCWLSLTEFGRELVDAGISAADAGTLDARHPVAAGLRAASTVLARADDDAIAWWRPEQPPLGFRLAAMGREFANAASSLTVAERMAVLSAVERVMDDSTDPVAAEAMATGFLEAIDAQWAAGRFDLVGMWDQFGPESQRYLRAWTERMGGRQIPRELGPD